MSLSVSFNDYGFHLCSNANLELKEKEWRNLLNPENLIEELLDCMNLSEMAKRQFREVARVAGLIFQGYPGSQNQLGKYRHQVDFSLMCLLNTTLKIYCSPSPGEKYWKGNLRSNESSPN